jgi:Recombination endonuclease VII
MARPTNRRLVPPDPTPAGHAGKTRATLSNVAAFPMFDAPKGTRPAPAPKVCTKCPERGAQPSENFAFSGKGYARQAVCKTCDTARTKAYRAGDPDRLVRHADARWRSHIRKTYGLQPADYDALLAAQGGVCRLCAQPEPARARGGGGPRRLAIDHCHREGHVRGLLCTPCNTAIGTAENFPGGAAAWARSALAYLAQVEHSPGAGTDKSGGSSGNQGPPSSDER